MYIASVTLENFLRSDVVEERYGLKTLDVLLRRRRLQWFGNEKRKGQEEILGRILELEVTASRPRGRSKRSKRKIVETDKGLV